MFFSVHSKNTGMSSSSDCEYTYVKSQRGGSMLNSGGYLYYREKCVNTSTFWKCSKYKSVTGSCPARAVTSNNKLKVCGVHNHAGDAVGVEARGIRSDLRKKSRETRDAPKFVLSESIASSSLAALGQLPTSLNLRRAVRNTRTVLGPRLRDPVRREEIMLYDTNRPRVVRHSSYTTQAQRKIDY